MNLSTAYPFATAWLSARPIPIEVRQPSVPGPTVGLEDQPPVRHAEITSSSTRPPPGQCHLADDRRDAGDLGYQVKQNRLEFAFGQLRALDQGVEHRPGETPVGEALGFGRCHSFFEVVERGSVADERAGPCVLELGESQSPGQVHEGLRYVGHTDAVHGGGAQVVAALDPGEIAPMVGVRRHSDLGCRAPGGTEVVNPSGCEPTDRGVRHGELGGLVLAQDRRWCAGDGEDTVAQQEQTPVVNASVELAGRDAFGQQLPAVDDAVLPARQVVDDRICSGHDLPSRVENRGCPGSERPDSDGAARAGPMVLPGRA